MKVRINLLPHREMRRERRKKDFVGLIALTVIATAGVAFLVAMTIDQQISTQQERNQFIQGENAKLDVQIKEIATLRAEIDSLKARQGAVESLQSDRTTPVHLLDELVKQVPDGIFLTQIKQVERRVTLVGMAQSNERVSELLRNLANETVWIERPELIEIKSRPLNPQQASRDKEGRIVYEFSMVASIKAPEAPKNGARTTTAAAGGTATLARAATAAR
ncbi:MAG: PilN domain-containing protein [Burkholderiaceae bacterium]